MELDELTSSLFQEFSVGDSQTAIYDPSRPHPRFSAYKSNKLVAFSQEKRRHELLERQKTNRFDYLSKTRNLSDIECDEENNEKCDQIPMDCQNSVQKKRFYNRNKKKTYADQLMLSEWLVDVPENFSEWFMVPCPKGKRALVIAAQGKTRVFSKTGYVHTTFTSMLPGGNASRAKYNTWLDCIWSEFNSTFYVLDVIVWQDIASYDGERDFRHFWLQQKFADLPGIDQTSESNRCRFILLPQCPCTKENMESLMNQELPYNLDGLLFYCNEAHYSPGLTPLVGWLKPFMMLEILNVTVPHKYANEGVGTTASQFIYLFNANEEKRQKKKKINDKCTEVSIEDN